MINAMTADVEDFFQVQVFADCISRGDWDRFPRHVEHNTNVVLDQLAGAGVKATFFTLGWVVQRHPRLVRRIVAEGHEVASQGWDHTLGYSQHPESFRTDVRRTKRALEDLAGTAVHGYRASTFPIGARTAWAFEILRQEGYCYSSSMNSSRHDVHGAPRLPFKLNMADVLEIPMTTVRISRRDWPCFGGGYFHLVPVALYNAGLRDVNRHGGQPGIFYFHPREIDAWRPRVADSDWKARLGHYTNLARMVPSLERLLRDVAWHGMSGVHASALNASDSIYG